MKKDEAWFNATIEEIKSLMYAKAGTPEAERLNALALLVVLYEEEHHKIEEPSLVDQIKFVVDQGGKPLEDLVEGLMGMEGMEAAVYSLSTENCPANFGLGCPRYEDVADCPIETQDVDVQRCWLRAMLGVKREK